MGGIINANITSKAAVRLLLSNEIDISGYLEIDQAELLLDELYNTSVAELLLAIDCIEPLKQVDSGTLPQFGSLDTLIRVPEVLASTGIDGLSYAQLGFYLQNSLGAKQSAYAKYGETHGKGACQLGITMCEGTKIRFGALTNAFNAIGNRERQHVLMQKLCFRIPVIQTLLNRAKYCQVNGYAPMAHLSKSTQERRGICAKMIFKELHALGNETLDQRIHNIYWDLDEENI